MADFKLMHHGSVVLLTPTTSAGTKWLTEHIDLAQAIRWGQCSVAVEPRYIDTVIDGICEDGLSLS